MDLIFIYYNYLFIEIFYRNKNIVMKEMKNNYSMDKNIILIDFERMQIILNKCMHVYILYEALLTLFFYSSKTPVSC